jgi:uncharacterized protein (TIGR00369 family)
MDKAGTGDRASVVTVDQMNGIVAESQFLKPFGFRVQSCAYGQCALLVPFKPELERPGGIVSGITIMAAADVAMWLAIMTQRGPGEHWVTTDLKAAFLRGARQENFVCTARVLKLGKRTAYGDAHCVGSVSGLLAHHVVSYAQALGGFS